jgi:hypothetical protein
MQMMDSTGLSDGMVRIRQQFVARLGEHLTCLFNLGAIIDQDGEVAESMLEAKLRAHMILGTASTLGFGRLGHLAAICEQDMETCLQITEPMQRNFEMPRESLNHLIAEIETVMDQNDTRLS